MARLEAKFDAVVDLINATLEQQPMLPPPEQITTVKPQIIEEITDLSQNRIIFSAVRKNGYVYGDVTYNRVPVNIGNGLVKNSGIFISPRNAIYSFSVTARSGGSNAGQSVISVMKNGILSFKITEGMDVDSANNINYNWIDRLESGDTLSLSVSGNKLYSGSLDHLLFQGFSLVIH